jgi:hypothetical protein
VSTRASSFRVHEIDGSRGGRKLELGGYGRFNDLGNRAELPGLRAPTHDAFER